MSSLDGKIAFITGGGSGIGRGIAERFARDGADVFVVDVDDDGAAGTAEIVTGLGRQAGTFHGNVASQEHMQEAVAQCVSSLGRIDIVVANAGIGRPASVLDQELKDWQDQIDINLTGVFLTVQAAARRMVELGNGGRIICMSSLAAEIASPEMFAYSATKAGVRMMVRAWAQDLGRHGITVNAIGPGIIETPLARGLAGDEGSRVRGAVESMTPVGRVGGPSDIAGLASFMAGPDGTFMTGAYVLMDGGLRDARPGRQPDAETAQEMQRYFEAAKERRQRMQPWLDER